jgi:hypothetical protein
MRLYSHVVTKDTGLAPNPFHGYCTTAVCAPSHMNAKLKRGDWLIGNSPKEDDYRLVYAMCISDILSMNQYFHDKRFESKKPKPDGTLIQQCGDNIYYQLGTGEWRRLPSRFHNNEEKFIQDVGQADHPVFVAEHYYYFGDRRVAIPDELAGVIKRGQGLGIIHNEHLIVEFVTWLEANYKPGRIGKPTMKDHSAEIGPMLTQLTEPRSFYRKIQQRSGGCR